MPHAVFSTAAGWMGVRASEAGLTRVILPSDTPEAVMTAMGVADTGDIAALGGIVEKFRQYFKGECVSFEVELDLSGATAFQQRIWQAARTIPHGEVRSYAWVAERAGCPRGQRAAGGALGANPLPVVIPCHRVIASNGRLGGFTGGIATKKRLLAIEGVGGIRED